MVQLPRHLDCRNKSAVVLSHKLREAMAQEVHTSEVLESDVEIDGAYFGGHIRPHNEKAKRIDRRLKQHQTGTGRVVIALRERDGRTLPFVGETEGDGVSLANETVSRTATMPADEAFHCDALHMGYHVDRVNHSEIYSDHRDHANMVESFFSRLCSMIEGQHHCVSPQYLHPYANHAAGLEVNRCTDNGTLAKRVVSRRVSTLLVRLIHKAANISAGCARPPYASPPVVTRRLPTLTGSILRGRAPLAAALRH